MKRKPAAPAIVRPKPGQALRLGELSPKQFAAFSRPSAFGRHVLGFDLSLEQAAVCDAFADNRSRVAAKFCNEAGKTTRVLPTVIMWHCTLFPRRGDNGGATCTSGSWSQIENQLMPALHALRPKFPAWDFNSTEIIRDGFPNFMAYSTINPGRAEGYHGSTEHPLAMFFDEAKSIPDDIIRAAEDRCRPQRLGLLSSPGFAMGRFYDSFSPKETYWDRHTVTFEQCPWIDRVLMRQVIERAGGGSYEKGLLDPYIRSAYFAEFMPFVIGSLISLVDIQKCLNDPPQPKPGSRHVRCDFARGGDENAIGVRWGNKVWLDKVWRERDTMAAAAQFVERFVEMRRTIGLQAHEIEGDADGMGGPVVDAIRSMGWPILEYHANSEAFDPSKYRNRESENWFEGAKKIERRQVILCDDEEMKIQMVDRQTRADPSGLRWIESKRDLFARQAKDKRPQRSPDRAEVIFGALAELPMQDAVSLAPNARPAGPWDDDPDIGPDLIEREASVPVEVLRGFDAGG